MIKVLYPKSTTPKVKHHKKARDLSKRPYHVFYSDPNDPTVPQGWRFYNSELAVKVAAWYHCRLLGFQPGATLYTRAERVNPALHNDVSQ